MKSPKSQNTQNKGRTKNMGFTSIFNILFDMCVDTHSHLHKHLNGQFSGWTWLAVAIKLKDQSQSHKYYKITLQES